MKSNLKHRFLEFVLRHRLFLPDERVLVAVSGGVDSMVLLHLLHTWRRRLKIEINVIHLHHGIRGTEADADSRFVERVSRELGVPFILLQESIPAYAEKHKLSVEEAGHQLREKLFEEVAAEQGCHKIATAHHRDDQAETVLMRLLSGSGLQGLAGIRLRKGKWVRPLLFAARREIEQYAREENIPFRTDHSNRDESILRNKIRHRLLPLLQSEYDPEVSHHLGHISFILQEWDSYIENEIQKAFEEGIICRFKNKITVEIEPFKLYFSWIKIRLVEHILNSLSSRPIKINYPQFSDFIHWLESGRPGSVFEWSDRLKSVRQAGKVIFYISRQQPKQSVKVFPGKWYQSPGGIIKLQLLPVEAGEVQFSKEKTEEFISGDQLTFPLVWRPWQAGDRFVPLGSRYSVLVSDYLTDRKIGKPDRDEITVLVNKDEIVAIVGVQISEKYRVQKESKILYRLTIKTDE